jgi:hypothetical protein
MRLDSPMTIHDANMQYFSQWWKRSVRCGHAYAHGYDLHRHDTVDGENSYKKKPLMSSLIYGLALPGLLVLIILMLIANSSGTGQWVFTAVILVLARVRLVICLANISALLIVEKAC